MSSPSPLYDVAAVRRQFPILEQILPNGRPLVYLDTAASAQKPDVVIDKIADVYRYSYANTHRGIHYLGDLVTTQVEQARDNVRNFLGARESSEIIFTSGTTSAINLVAHGWARKWLKPGDEILLSVMEHHANFVPWQQAALATGAKLRLIPLTDDGRLELSRLDEVLTERTRLVAVTAISNVLGTINPLAEIVSRAHALGAVVAVDGAQSVPHQAVNVVAEDIDFLSFSGHKLYGPSGIGVLYGKRKLLETMEPLQFGGNMINEVTVEKSTWADLPARFEAGTMAIAPAIALGTAIEFVQGLGLEALHQHEMALLQKAWQTLNGVPGLRIYGPGADQRSAMISFTLEGVHPHDLADLFNQCGVAIRAGHHCTMPLHDHLDVAATARVSFGCYNTLEEIDVLAEAIEYARSKFRRPGRG